MTLQVYWAKLLALDQGHGEIFFSLLKYQFQFFVLYLVLFHLAYSGNLKLGYSPIKLTSFWSHQFWK